MSQNKCCVVFFVIVGRVHLQDVKSVEQSYERIKEALKMQLTRPRNNDPFIFQSVMGLLPELRTLNARHNDKLHWYRLQWKYLTTLPPLFAEIFDIPKSEEEVDGLSMINYKHVLVLNFFSW